MTTLGSPSIVVGWAPRIECGSECSPASNRGMSYCEPVSADDGSRVVDGAETSALFFRGARFFGAAAVDFADRGDREARPSFSGGPPVGGFFFSAIPTFL